MTRPRVRPETARAPRPDGFRDECGVFAAFDPTGARTDLSRVVHLGLFALQHRGQESAGIAVRQGADLLCHKALGLVVEAFDDHALNILQGPAAIGHVRYATSGGGGTVNAQPLLMKTLGGPMALAHNGNLVDAEVVRAELEAEGAMFRTRVDSETLLYLIARRRLLGDDLATAVRGLMARVHGAYSVVLITPDSVAAFRDPLGIRPLCMGRLGDVVLFASESCAIEACGGVFERDLAPGEIVVLDGQGLRSDRAAPGEIPLDAAGAAIPPAFRKGALCAFEFVYFARPDSTLDGAGVHESRYRAGARLAEEHPVAADVVIGAPDSGITAGLGYADRSGIPFGAGLLKNRYVGRTFIQPSQAQRENSVNLKFSVLRRAVEGLRVVLVDDSIVRGTTMQRVIRKLRDAGAAEVHMRIASPPVRHPCYYGIDTPDYDELLANSEDLEGIRRAIGADTLGYLSQEGLVASATGLATGLCTSCFDGSYPAGRIEPPSGRRAACCGALPE